MCGRYACGEADALAERVERTNLALDEVRQGRQSTISFNISPGRYGPVYRTERDPASSGNTQRQVVDWMKWGLIPSFAKEPKIGSTFNARAESLAEHSGLWNGVKQYKRCIVLAQGYFEWQKRANAKGMPHFVHRKDGKLLCMAGLWDMNHKVEDEPVYTYTVVTTAAHDGMMWLHDRMPVILEPEDVPKWLRPGDKWNDHEKEFLSLLRPMDADKLEVYEVTPEVGKLSNDYVGLTQPLAEAKGTINSFFKPAGKNPTAPSPSKVKKKSTFKKSPGNAKITSFFKQN